MSMSQGCLHFQSIFFPFTAFPADNGASIVVDHWSVLWLRGAYGRECPPGRPSRPRHSAQSDQGRPRLPAGRLTGRTVAPTGCDEQADGGASRTSDPG